ncbi:metalloregulator ArsR/SmtB family transcription factor [Gorillibacterium sp. sgz5001074]|uniref:DUF2087 domain-containing protein n=1 Tax=Gorillibacterium sp. sgz5001074 TaxID=3446695 RepID=UPI003F675BBE
MQLEKVVNFHKALADPTRLKLLILLGDGEWSGQVLAERLGVTPATVTHHASKLRAASLVRERRDKNTVFFSLDREVLHSFSGAAAELITRGEKKGDGEEMEEANVRLRNSVLKNFFTPDGRLKQVPVQLKKKLIVLEHLVSRLELGRRYTEKEINEYIKGFHEDFATIRREFIMHQFMFRDPSGYEMNPRELWTHWETLTS